MLYYHIIILLFFVLTSKVSYAADPLALHDLVVVESGKDVVIRLKGYDLDGDKLSISLDTLPTSTTTSFTQLSHVYSNYGYLPIKGTSLSQGETISDSYNRIYYARPRNDMVEYEKWDTFQFHVHDGSKKSQSARVTLVPPTGTLVGSHFLTSNEDWTIVGNGQSAPSAASYERSSRGKGMSYFVHGSDLLLNVPTPPKGSSTLGSGTDDDLALWYFQAPAKFLQKDLGIAYGGTLGFTLASFSGNFADVSARNTKAPLVILECESCAQYSKVTLAFPLSKAVGTNGWDGNTKSFSLPLLETAGWLEDPENSVKTWTAPSKCTFIEVLSNLSGLRILGDFTSWYESVGLDNVSIANLKNQLPVCAQGSPDATICSC